MESTPKSQETSPPDTVSPSKIEWTSEHTGKTYRLGYLNATWSFVRNPPDQTNLQQFQRQFRRENIISRSDDLYHYTTIAGFQGIVQSGGFWASDSRFMNDAQEMKDGAELAGEVLAHRARKAAKSGISDVLTAVRDKIVAGSTEGILLVCFSTVSDSLEQWRGYGREGGICIKLGASKPGQRSVFFGPQQLPFRALYKFRQKAELLLSVIHRFESEYELDKQAMYDHWPSDQDKHYIDQLRSQISYSIVAFKNESFALESEVRLAINASYEDKYEGGFKFRVTPLGLVPYLCTGDLKKNDGLLPLAEVMIGPHPRQELIAESVEIFLRHHGYDVPVNLSKVPYRA